MSTTKPCRVQGLAVSWCKEAVYYISFQPADPLVISFLVKMLGSKHTQKITFDLKAQMTALLNGELYKCSDIATVRKKQAHLSDALHLQSSICKVVGLCPCPP